MTEEHFVKLDEVLRALQNKDVPVIAAIGDENKDVTLYAFGTEKQMHKLLTAVVLSINSRGTPDSRVRLSDLLMNIIIKITPTRILANQLGQLGQRLSNLHDQKQEEKS